MRERYDKFLGSYKYSDVYGLSSNHIRTKMTLQLVLAGLYLPSPEQTWNPTLHWLPVPYSQVTTKLDVLLEPNLCPK